MVYERTEICNLIVNPYLSGELPATVYTAVIILHMVVVWVIGYIFFHSCVFHVSIVFLVKSDFLYNWFVVHTNIIIPNYIIKQELYI